MFQKFFTNTIMSTFIKNLLATTPIPLLPSIKDGDTMLQGASYLYKDFVIKCVKSGRVKVDESEVLYPSDNLYPSHLLYPGTGEACAQFRVLSVYDPENELYNYTYHSKFTHYDSDTHKHLGEYLRYLKNIKGLDLMGYYNCYNYNIVDNVQLHSLNPDTNKTYTQTSKKGYKVLSVPIKFFQTYTIALECDTQVEIRCVIYGDSGMIIDTVASTSATSTGTVYFSDYLENTYKVFNNTQFDNPFIINIPTNNPRLFNQQNNLHLLIQIPETNTSSIVVLEGDYRTQTSTTIIKAKKQSTLEDGKIVTKILPHTETVVEYFDPNLSLLRMNSGYAFAFSDRLIEYLLLNVIHPGDEITENIERVRRALLEYYEIKKTLASRLVADTQKELNKTQDEYKIVSAQIVKKTDDKIKIDRLLASNNLSEYDRIVYQEKSETLQEEISTLTAQKTELEATIERLNTELSTASKKMKENVEVIEGKMAKITRVIGIWDESLTSAIKELISDNKNFYELVDVDGNVNKDIESILLSEGVDY